jgi:hypothetical protein
MLEKINWTVNIQVMGGPAISETKTIEVDAYDKIDVVIEDGTTDKEVQVQPGSTGVQFLMIKTDNYGDKLKYKVNDGTSSTSDINLDSPVHLFIGSGSIGLFGKAPIKFLFSNSLGKNAAVNILVGRDATP